MDEQRTINVKQYGAKCDNQTNDAEAVQRAVDAASASDEPCVVFIPAFTLMDFTDAPLTGAGGRVTIHSMSAIDPNGSNAEDLEAE